MRRCIDDDLISAMLWILNDKIELSVTEEGGASRRSRRQQKRKGLLVTLILILNLFLRPSPKSRSPEFSSFGAAQNSTDDFGMAISEPGKVCASIYILASLMMAPSLT